MSTSLQLVPAKGDRLDGQLTDDDRVDITFAGDLVVLPDIEEGRPEPDTEPGPLPASRPRGLLMPWARQAHGRGLRMAWRRSDEALVRAQLPPFAGRAGIAATSRFGHLEHRLIP